MLELYEYKGAADGERVLILGSVHGNEVCGSLAIDKIRHELDTKVRTLTRGTLLLAPRVNKEAYKKNTRFIDVNLNRIVSSNRAGTNYEDKLARELATLIESVDIVIDIHSMTAKTVSMAFVDYPTETNKKLAQASLISSIVYGWQDLFVEDNESGDTIACANASGKSGITIECGTHNDSESVHAAERAILGVLKDKQMMDGVKFEEVIQRSFLMKEVIFRNSLEDRLAKEFTNFEKVLAGEVLGVREDKIPILAKEDGYIMLPNKNAGVGAEWFYFGVIA